MSAPVTSNRNPPPQSFRSNIKEQDVLNDSAGTTSQPTRTYPITNVQQQRQWRQNLCWFNPTVRRQRIQNFLNDSILWRVVIAVNTAVLLFGGSIRDLFLPAQGDIVFNVLFLVAMLIFATDIAMRIDSEPHYFNFYCNGKNQRKNAPTFHSKNEHENENGNKIQPISSVASSRIFSVGSFLFWCDCISTIVLVYEISWFNPDNFDPIWITLYLDSNNIPSTGSFLQTSGRYYVELDSQYLFACIGKTARMARVIRSPTVVKLSSKVDWYLIPNLFNITWWYDLVRKCFSKEKKKDSVKSNISIIGRSDVPRISGSTHSRSGAFDTRNSGSLPKPIVTASSAVMIIVSMLARRRNWGDYRRNEAASIIQNAWRRRKRRLALHNLADLVSFQYEKSAYFDHEPHTQSLMPLPRNSRLRRGLSGFMSLASQSSKLSRRKTDSLGSRSTMRVNSTSRVGASERAISSALVDAAANKGGNEFQVGTAMREITGQRVAIGIIFALVMTVLFTVSEGDRTRQSAMLTLHTQTQFDSFITSSLNAARKTSIPDLFSYQLGNGTIFRYDVVEHNKGPDQLRPREILNIDVVQDGGRVTLGQFSIRSERREEALVSLLSTLFIIMIWFFGATAFAGPVMVLVVIPMERMVKLLAMLTLDPLGFQNTSRYRKFVVEEDEFTKNTRWTKEVLKGMETSFLMSTILRIGSLMKVGFGSAGVEIIRRNLNQEQSKNMLILSSQGTTVSCIFLFCDIRNFTDATECLQEEVFVFTNRIAAVVHSHCAAYGGSANKNVGDAFLMSWLLDDEGQHFSAKTEQADKALLAVVRMCMNLRYDDYYLGEMSDFAREALVTKLKDREGPILQMGFGLHAGKAVQGAIGSQKKIDATYVGESVERAEFLESSTKKYGLPMLMSDSFHRLLDQRNKRRCRKVDHIMICGQTDDDDDENGELMDLLTFDMDIDAWWNMNIKLEQEAAGDNVTMSKKEVVPHTKPKSRKVSMLLGYMPDESNDDFGVKQKQATGRNENSGIMVKDDDALLRRPEQLTLPNGPVLYNSNVWFGADMRKIRERFSDGIFFQKFNSGLQAFYNRDWEYARECFETLLARFEDGPSRYFLTQIENSKGKPPRDFRSYGIA